MSNNKQNTYKRNNFLQNTTDDQLIQELKKRGYEVHKWDNVDKWDTDIDDWADDLCDWEDD